MRRRNLGVWTEPKGFIEEQNIYVVAVGKFMKQVGMAAGIDVLQSIQKGREWVLEPELVARQRLKVVRAELPPS